MTSIDGPEATEDPKQRALATAIGACYEQVHAWTDLAGGQRSGGLGPGRDVQQPAHLEAELGGHHILVGSDDWHLFQNNGITAFNDSALDLVLLHLWRGGEGWVRGYRRSGDR